jgi:peptidoglycan hydrolase-like protein with peptidoglycan-binding domain
MVSVTRLMADATHDNVAYIPSGMPMVAGYITGSPDIQWTNEDWMRFQGKVHVTIDQGFTGAPRYDANVIDVETGAYSVDHVTSWMGNATAKRPTLYVNRSNVLAACHAALASPRFKGDVWLAYPGWDQSIPLPQLPFGCHYVAVQDMFSLHYDESTVLDDLWPDSPEPAPSPTNWTEETVKQLPLTGPGATGVFVRRIQGLCLANGVSVGKAGMDGIYGNDTANAVMTIQRRHNATGASQISVDPWVGEQTWPVLLGV